VDLSGIWQILTGNVYGVPVLVIGAVALLAMWVLLKGKKK
jgi:hypothetical protein